ncbi:hypothetical protein BX600DRAFT_507175 [Xylariales sp. PMI_506]|nr:hypothetical protein BX600DRAFT_507175 [Xylariales sp. PMI_506]
MDALPSYEEAITEPHWLKLVVPYVSATDWRRCCLVDSDFYRHFAPYLWLDPLVSARKLGLHPNDDLAWYRRFINHVKSVRVSTRSLVRSLDFRAFAVTASGLYSTEASERAISESFKNLPQLFPQLLCLLITGHPELDPGTLVRASASGEVHGALSAGIHLLDLADCPHELTSKLFTSSFFKNLVYLDVSGIPGSVNSAVKSSLNPEFLPELRILKVRGREMDLPTAILLFRAFRMSLWSLDISHNKLSDEIIHTLLESCFSSLSFRSQSHFDTEGKLVNPRKIGTREYGAFEFIEESDYSATFDHPERYIPDAPPYLKRADQGGLQEWQVVRSNGIAPSQDDSATAISHLLLSDSLEETTSSAGFLNLNMRTQQGGLTHLYLNGNSFTRQGLGKILRGSAGRLQKFESDICRFWLPEYAVPRPLPGSLRVFGHFGLAHLFRPVVSCNIQTLRVHHSLITNIPSLTAEGLSMLNSWVFAETTFRQRIDLAFPQTYTPNMNPRIKSLTLAGIPPLSTGPLISALSQFLELASQQQQEISEAEEIFHQRGSSVLGGLRHIRLELEPDYSDDTIDMRGDDDVSFDDLLDPANYENEQNEFSQRQNATAEGSSSSPLIAQSSKRSWSISKAPSQLAGDPKSMTSAQGFSHPSEQEFVLHQVEASDSWNGKAFEIPVWVGTGIPGTNAAVNEYMSNLRDIKLHTNVGPATPGHVAAGVPPGSYLFHDAWDAMVFPKSLAPLQSSTLRSKLEDVASAIKNYRLSTKGTSRHWGGKLELVRTNSAARYQSSEYWR